MLTSLGFRTDILGLCCHNGVEKQNIRLFLLSKFVFESCYGTEANKLISLLSLVVCFGFLGLLFFCKALLFLGNLYNRK